MKQIIIVNATSARKNLFRLIDQVDEKGFEVIIQKGPQKKSVLLTSVKKKHVTSADQQMEIVKKTAGAIKTKGYKPNEAELAREHFIKTYTKKNGN